MTIAADLAAATAAIQADAAKLHAIVNGPATGGTSLVTLADGVTQVKTLARIAYEAASGGFVPMNGSGDASVTRDITAARYVNATLGVLLNSILSLYASGNYTIINDPAGHAAMQFGNATDPANYAINDVHNWYNRAANVILASLTSTGLGVGGAPSYKLDVQGTVIGDVVSRLYNASTNAAATATFMQSVGGRYVLRSIFYNGQYMAEVGSGITARYSDFDTQYFRTNGGAEMFNIGATIV